MNPAFLPNVSTLNHPLLEPRANLQRFLLSRHCSDLPVPESMRVPRALEQHLQLGPIRVV
jgi:hypothetical protein